MSARSVWCRAVGAASIVYGVLIVLFWVWNLWLKDPPARDFRPELPWLLLYITAPVFLLVAGFALLSGRVAVREARTLRIAAVAVLAVKAVAFGQWAVRLLLTTGPFSSLVHEPALYGLALIVAPSAVWAGVLAWTSLPAVPPALEDRPSP